MIRSDVVVIGGGFAGTATDITIQAAEINRLKGILNGILAKHCGKELPVVEKDTDRDFFMSAAEAKEYGLVDEVIMPGEKSSGEKKPL